MDRESRYSLSPCTLDGIEGEGWARYENSTFTQNLIGAVYFDPEQSDAVGRLFDDNSSATYSGTVYFDDSVEQREVSVELEVYQEKSDGKPAKRREPHIEGHPCIEFIAPGNPFSGSDTVA